MPNWCTTMYYFCGNESEIKYLRSKVDEWTSGEYIKTDFGEAWLGNILHGAGLASKIDAKNDGLSCRGYISYIGEVELTSTCCFCLNTETAWVPMTKMWQAVIDKLHLASVKFCYIAEECGCELYQIYDPNDLGFFDIYDYAVDCYLPNEFDGEIESDYYNRDDLKKRLQKAFNNNSDDLEELLALVDNYDFGSDDYYISIHAFDYI